MLPLRRSACRENLYEPLSFILPNVQHFASHYLMYCTSVFKEIFPSVASISFMGSFQ